MKPELIRHGPHQDWGEQAETLQVEKRGGPLGDVPRFYVISSISKDGIIDPTAETFIDLVDALGMLAGKTTGDSDRETLAFAISGLNLKPEDWDEVAGHVWNGVSIEQIAEEILRNEEL